MTQELGLRAVIIDGWPMIRIGLARVLASVGVRTVAEVGDGSAALAVVAREPVDLLVIGDHTGATSALLLEVGRLPEPPRSLVILSSVSPADIRELLDAGASGLLTRRVEPEELADAVRRLHGGERVLSPSLVPLLFDGDSHQPTSPEVPAGLTPKEREVIRLLAVGSSNASIAAALFVSEATVKTHLGHIYTKLGVRGRREAVLRAVAMGLVL